MRRAGFLGLNVPEDVTADDLAALAPWLTFPDWLGCALADLLATLRNICRSEDDAPTYRDEVLDAWRLHALANRDRRDREAARKASDKTNLLSLINRYKDQNYEEAHAQ